MNKFTFKSWQRHLCNLWSIFSGKLFQTPTYYGEFPSRAFTQPATLQRLTVSYWKKTFWAVRQDAVARCRLVLFFNFTRAPTVKPVLRFVSFLVVTAAALSKLVRPEAPGYPGPADWLIDGVFPAGIVCCATPERGRKWTASATSTTPPWCPGRLSTPTYRSCWTKTSRPYPTTDAGSAGLLIVRWWRRGQKRKKKKKESKEEKRKSQSGNQSPLGIAISSAVAALLKDSLIWFFFWLLLWFFCLYAKSRLANVCEVNPTRREGERNNNKKKEREKS